MNHRFRWAVVLAAVLFAGIVGVVSYNAGLSHGLAVAARTAAEAPGAPVPPVPYGWYRPWGYGFGFFPFFPFALLFWFLLFRLVFWGGFHRRRWYYAGGCDARGSFDEWHRRAHERMSGEGPAQAGGNV